LQDRDETPAAERVVSGQPTDERLLA
jgi:hypothetical protein